MKKKLSLPFQNMTPRGWQNLAIAAAITFYLILMGSTFINSGICEKSTMDFCAYWISGKIINQRSYADIYDLNVQREFQQAYFSFSRIPEAQTFAMMYPPVFVVPFQFLSFLSPTLSYIIWTSINLLGFIFYLFFFVKKVGKNPATPRYLLLALISLPIFINFYEGQVNIWLAVCAGEFIRALLEGKPYKAGLWLGGWLIKPQILLLVIPFILFQRLFKAFWGFLTSSFTVLLFSYLLIGTKGFLTLYQALQTSAGGGGVSNPLGMMNWRMLGSQISLITSSTAGLIITITGSIITLGITFYVLRKRIKPNSTEMVVAILAIFSATLLVTYHAHFHMIIILIPAMLYLLDRGRFSLKLFLFWVFMPIAIEFLDRNSLILIHYDFPLSILGPAIKLLEGLRGFTLNMLVFLWSIQTIMKGNLKTKPKVLPKEIQPKVIDNE
jgi:hypothetical protein